MSYQKHKIFKNLAPQFCGAEFEILCFEPIKNTMKTTMLIVRIVAVVLTASIFFPCKLFASQADSYIYAQHVRAFINVEATKPQYEINNGREIFVSPTVLYEKSHMIKVSFEINRMDGNYITYPIDRLNLLNLGFEGRITVGDQNWVTGIYMDEMFDFSAAGAVYTTATSSPPINEGMYVIPFDPDGSIITSLIGTPVQDPHPFITGGNFKVHSNSALKVQKVLVLNMPLKLRPGEIAALKSVRDANPKKEVSLVLSSSTIANFSLNIQNGCNHYLSFLYTNNVCKIRYDGALKPSSPDFIPKMEIPGEVSLPVGSTSWLDLWESSNPGEKGRKVDFSKYGFEFKLGGPTGITGITITGLPIHERKFYVLRTRVD